MKIGIRAHDCGTLPVNELAKKVSSKGFSSVQLALLKAIDGIDTSLGKLNPGMAYYIKEAFNKENVQIAVLGCYLNIASQDINERKLILDRYKEHIRFARDFGCSIVGTETGSINDDYSFSTESFGEEAFHNFIINLKEVVEEAEKFGVFIAIEGVSSHIINNPKRMKRALDTINSNNLQVIFDPVNYLTIENYKDQDELIMEAFELFGDKIVIIHAKDFIVENNTIKGVAPGNGMLNYELIMKFIKYKKPYLNVLLEDAKEEDMEESRAFFKILYDKV